MARTGKTIAIIAFTLTLVNAQAPRPSFDAFEVATIKPTDPDSRGRYIKMQSAHQLYATGHTLKTLIAAAWNLTPRCISGGPEWVESDRYDILARTPNNVRPDLEEQMTMLRKLLAERFHLVFHREAKEFSIYELTIAKGGPKLRESTTPIDASPEGPPLLAFILGAGVVSLPARNATIGEMASVLQRAALERPVIDKTGLTARYDFDLEFTPDDSQFGGMASTGTAESTKPDLFRAMQQQLGLKLEATRGSIQMIVIDHAEKPGDN